MITYDQNEEVTSNIPQRLKELGIPIVRTVQGTDYIINNKVAVERKTAADYIQSKITKDQKGATHLDLQLTEMSTNFNLSYLVIIGNPLSALIKRNLPRTIYLSSLVGSSLKRAAKGKQGQIVTVNLDTDHDFLLFLKYLHLKIENNDLIRTPKFERIKASSDDQKIILLTSLPNVGMTRAKLILNHYVTLENFLFTIISNPELASAQIKGLSKKSAQQIRNILVTKYGKSNQKK